MEKLLKDLYKRSRVDWEVINYKDSKSYCYYDNKKLIGYCQTFDDSTICNLIVDPEYRGQGIGSNLLEQSNAKYLACIKSNVRFYVNRGFKVYYVEYDEDFKSNLYYMRKCERG